MNEFDGMKDYELVGSLHQLANDWNYENADLSPIQAEIERRGIKLTKPLVKQWWYKHNKGLEGRMRWEKPKGSNNHWDKDTVAVYTDGTISIIYCSLEAIVADIGEL